MACFFFGSNSEVPYGTSRDLSSRQLANKVTLFIKLLMSVVIDFAAGVQCGYIGGEGALHPHRVRECSHQQNRSEQIQFFLSIRRCRKRNNKSVPAAGVLMKLSLEAKSAKV
jgi:hypothetical protein